MLYYTSMKRLARDKHSCLLGQFISYEENISVVNTAPGTFVNFTLNFDNLDPVLNLCFAYSTMASHII